MLDLAAVEGSCQNGGFQLLADLCRKNQCLNFADVLFLIGSGNSLDLTFALVIGLR